MLPHVSWIQSPDRKNAAEVTDEGEVSSTCFVSNEMLTHFFRHVTVLKFRMIKVSLTEESDEVHRTIISVYPGAFSFIARWLLKSNKGAARSLPSPDPWWALIYSRSLRNIINAAYLLAVNYASRIVYWRIDVQSANDSYYPFILWT